jgi:hypothetical protein
MNTAEFQEAMEQVRKRKDEETRWRLADGMPSANPVLTVLDYL